jgi:predicted metal-dependent phosphotriesterase family hydrolase
VCGSTNGLCAREVLIILLGHTEFQDPLHHARQLVVADVVLELQHHDALEQLSKEGRLLAIANLCARGRKALVYVTVISNPVMHTSMYIYPFLKIKVKLSAMFLSLANQR